MAVVTAFDSGVSTPLTPGPWEEFLVASVPSPNPLQVILRLDFVRAPAPTWHTAGSVFMRLSVQSQLFGLPMSTIALIVSEQSAPSGYAYAARAVLVPKSPGVAPSVREASFRGVSWSIHRWLGQYRARVVYID